MNVGTTEIILILFVATSLVLPLAVVIFLVIYKRAGHENLKKCAFCAEMIQSEAVVCRYCNRNLP